MTTISTITPTPSPQRAERVLAAIRAVILNGTDHQALAHLQRIWPALVDKERVAVKRKLQEHGYRGDPFAMLKEWAYERLHPTDRPRSPLRPEPRPAIPKGNGREYWAGKYGSPFLRGGLPQ